MTKYEDTDPTIVLYITKLYCVKDSAESSSDDVYFRVYRDGSSSYEQHRRDSPTHMDTGNSRYIDLSIKCDHVNKVRVRLMEKDTSSDDDILGDFDFDKNTPIDQNGEGTMQRKQTTGQAQAEYRVYYRVISKPIPTLRVFGLYCHHSTDGISEDVADALATMSEELLSYTSEILKKSPRPKRKAQAKMFEKAANIMGNFGPKLITYFANKREGDDEVYLNHVGPGMDGNDGALYPDDGKFIRMREEMTLVEEMIQGGVSFFSLLRHPPGPAEVYFDEGTHPLSDGAEYLRIALPTNLDQNNLVTIQLKEKDRIKPDVAIGHYTITKEEYDNYKDCPRIMYLDEYFDHNTQTGQGALYSMVYSFGLEDWSKPATSWDQGGDAVYDNLDSAVDTLNKCDVKHRCIVPICKSTKKAGKVQNLEYKSHKQKEGSGGGFNKYWDGLHDIARMQQRAEEMYEDYCDIHEDEIIDNETIYVCYQSWKDQYNYPFDIHTTAESARKALLNTSTATGNHFQAVVPVKNGQALDPRKLSVDGDYQSNDSTRWNTNIPVWPNGGDWDVWQMQKRSELRAYKLVMVGEAGAPASFKSNTVYDKVGDAQCALNQNASSWKYRAVIPILKSSGKAMGNDVVQGIQMNGERQGDGGPWKKYWYDNSTIDAMKTKAEDIYKNWLETDPDAQERRGVVANPLYVVAQDFDNEWDDAVVYETSSLREAKDYQSNLNRVVGQRKFQCVVKIENGKWTEPKNLVVDNTHQTNDNNGFWHANFPDQSANGGTDTDFYKLMSRAEQGAFQFVMVGKN